MAKFTPVVLESGYLSAEAINANFAQLATLLEQMVSRDGTLPNEMDSDLDMNGHSLLNTGVDPNDPAGLVTVETLHDYVDARASGVVVQSIETQVATGGQTVVLFSTVRYTPGANNLAFYVNGVRQFVGLDYIENSPSQITMLSGLADGRKLTAIVNEFLGTVILPDHSHLWSDIIDPPATATRWPDYTEVTGKPATFPPSSHVHSTADITTGSGLADARRGIWVQSGTPTATRVGDLWFW